MAMDDPMLVATGLAKIAGGAFSDTYDSSRPVINGMHVLLVGDTTICSAHIFPITTTIVTTGSSLTMNVRGIPIARVGNETSCGHPILDGGTNTTVKG